MHTKVSWSNSLSLKSKDKKILCTMTFIEIKNTVRCPYLIRMVIWSQFRCMINLPGSASGSLWYLCTHTHIPCSFRLLCITVTNLIDQSYAVIGGIRGSTVGWSPCPLTSKYWKSWVQLQLQSTDYWTLWPRCAPTCMRHKANRRGKQQQCP